MKTAYKLSTTTLETPVRKDNLLLPLAALWLRLQQLFVALVMSLSPVKTRRVAIVGSGATALKLQRFFELSAWGYDCLGLFDANDRKFAALQGDVEALKGYARENGLDELYYAGSPENTALIQELAAFCDQHFIYFRVANAEKPAAKVSSFYYDEVPVVALRREPLASRANQVLKRAFDIVFSLVVLAILIPFVFPIIALAIKLESRGPVFFVQMRPGFKNKLFPCFKFRSMAVNGETERQATKNDMRITKVGAFLRKTSLDELPQFVNVLLGHMSVVGPRPNMQKQLEYYSTVIDNYAFRHFTMPGITGWAQVNGYRGETQTVEAMARRVELDIEYMQKWSLWLDIKIIFRTAYNIVKGEENAY